VSSANSTFKITLAVLATWFIWGSTYLAIRFALLDFRPFELMGLRFLSAGLMLLCVCRYLGSRWPTYTEWRHALIVGALMLGGGMGSAAFAEQSVSSGLVVTFIAVSPLIMSLMLIAFGQYPTRRELVGLIIGTSGVIVLAQGQGFHASPAGLIAVLIGCVTWNLGSVLSRYKIPLTPGVMGYASEMVMGGLVLLGMSAMTQEHWPSWHSARAVGAFIFLIIFGSLIAFNAYMYLLERVRPALTLSYTYVNPLIGLSLGMWLADETLTQVEAIGAGVILLGLIIALTGRRENTDAHA